MIPRMRLLTACLLALPILSTPAFAQDCEKFEFTVYFETDASKLSRTGEAVIEAASQRHEDGCTLSRVHVAAHTDTSEGMDEIYSGQLSMARAEHVTDLLVNYGITRSLIWTGGGKDDYPAHATGPDVKEPLNRRAEITFIYE